MLDRVVLILSEYSINSPWIESFIDDFLKREREVNHPLLILCQLDNAITRTERTWLVDLLKTHQMLDFTQWGKKEIYDGALLQLLTVFQTKQ